VKNSFLLIHWLSLVLVECLLYTLLMIYGVSWQWHHVKVALATYASTQGKSSCFSKSCAVRTLSENFCLKIFFIKSAKFGAKTFICGKFRDKLRVLSTDYRKFTAVCLKIATFCSACFFDSIHHCFTVYHLCLTVGM